MVNTWQHTDQRPNEKAWSTISRKLLIFNYAVGGLYAKAIIYTLLIPASSSPVHHLHYWLLVPTNCKTRLIVSDNDGRMKMQGKFLLNNSQVRSKYNSTIKGPPQKSPSKESVTICRVSRRYKEWEREKVEDNYVSQTNRKLETRPSSAKSHHNGRQSHHRMSIIRSACTWRTRRRGPIESPFIIKHIAGRTIVVSAKVAAIHAKTMCK